MRILAIQASYGLDGSTISLGNSIRTLTKNGYKVSVLYRYKDQGSDYLERCGASLIYFNFPLRINTTVIHESSHFKFSKLLFLYLKDILKFFVGIIVTAYYLNKYNPHILLCNDSTYPQCALVAFLMRIPVVQLLQTEILKGRWGYRRNLLIYLINKSRKAIGITKWHIEPFIKKYKNTGKYLVIPNTIYETKKIDNEDLFRDWLSHEILKRNIKIIFYCGGASLIKGYSFLPQIVKALTSMRTDVMFIVAGAIHRKFSNEWCVGTANDGFDATKQLFQFIQNCQLQQYVKIIGQRSDILNLMKQSDVVLVPNYLPHFPRPVIEAFYVGTSVVATNDKFSREIINDGVNGFLADYCKLDEWVTKINILLDDESIRAKFRQKSLMTFMNNYNKDIVEKQFLQAVESVHTRKELEIKQLMENP